MIDIPVLDKGFCDSDAMSTWSAPIPDPEHTEGLVWCERCQSWTPKYAHLTYAEA